MDYGIAVRNKFELFLDDDDADPLEILRLKEEENAQQKKNEVKGKDAKSAKDTKSAKNKKNNKALSTVQDQKVKSAEPRDVKKDDKPLRNKSRNDDRQNRPPRENRERDLPPRRQQQQENRPAGFGAPGQQAGNEFRDRNDGGRGRGERRGRGGRGRGGGRGGPGGFDRFGKREFERHSGSDRTSGIKATEKREGGGAHNWGTVKDDIDDQLNTSNPAEQNAEWAAPAEDVENQQPTENTEGGEEAPQEEDPSASEMTLDEWRALQNKEKQASSFNVRKPGEGCDNSQWKKTYMLKKKVEEEESDEDEDDEDYEDERRKRSYVPIEITFGDQSRRGGSGGRGGRGGRGRGGMEGRGGGRGRGSRGGPRGGGGQGGGGRREQAPNVEDEQDFPSLGKPAA